MRLDITLQMKQIHLEGQVKSFARAGSGRCSECRTTPWRRSWPRSPPDRPPLHVRHRQRQARRQHRIPDAQGSGPSAAGLHAAMAAPDGPAAGAVRGHPALGRRLSAARGQRADPVRRDARGDRPGLRRCRSIGTACRFPRNSISTIGAAGCACPAPDFKARMAGKTLWGVCALSDEDFSRADPAHRHAEADRRVSQHGIRRRAARLRQQAG